MLDGDALSEAQMQAIAKQAGFSECAFVCRSDKADLRLRFFMPLQETGLCGHATVASICALMEQDAAGEGRVNCWWKRRPVCSPSGTARRRMRS